MRLVGTNLQGDRMGSRLWLHFNKKMPWSAAASSVPAGNRPAWREQLHGASLTRQRKAHSLFLNQNAQFYKRALGKLKLKLHILLFPSHLLVAALRQSCGWKTEPALATGRICYRLQFMGKNDPHGHLPLPTPCLALSGALLEVLILLERPPIELLFIYFLN